MKILLKRAYEKPAKDDGFRVLVDRLWPRGVSKEKLRLDLWAKDISPTTELRQWFGHDPGRWLEFCKRYKVELKDVKIRQAIAATIEAAAHSSALTLVYGAKDTEHNEALVLQAVFKRIAGSKARNRKVAKPTE